MFRAAPVATPATKRPSPTRNRLPSPAAWTTSRPAAAALTDRNGPFVIETESPKTVRSALDGKAAGADSRMSCWRPRLCSSRAGGWRDVRGQISGHLGFTGRAGATALSRNCQPEAYEDRASARRKFLVAGSLWFPWHTPTRGCACVTAVPCAVDDPGYRLELLSCSLIRRMSMSHDGPSRLSSACSNLSTRCRSSR